MTLKEELKEALKNGCLYGFISNEGHRFNKNDLIIIIKNLDFAIYQTQGEKATIEAEKQTIEGLNDYDFFEE